MSSNRTATIEAAALTCAPLAIGGAPGHAEQGSATSGDPFDPAQYGLGLSPADVVDHALGVSAEASAGDAVVSLGDTDVKTSSAEDRSSTTVLDDGVRAMSLLDQRESTVSFAIDVPGADGPGAYWNMYGYQVKAVAAASVATVGAALGAPTLHAVWSGVRATLTNTWLTSSSCDAIRILSGSGLHKVAKSNCA